MARSSGLSKAYSAVAPFSDFLFILQSEEYNLARYFHWLPRFFFRRNFLKNESLVRTMRAKVMLGTTYLVFFAVIAVLVYLFLETPVVLGLALLLTFLAAPLFVAVGYVLTAPWFGLAKKRLWARARTLIKSRSGLRIIAIAGSYGKTTTRSFVYELVRHTYRTQMMERNINTTTGIAAWLTKNLQPTTELLIIETDAYARGEIRDTARIVPPDIAIITNVGDQHMARFRTKANLAATLRELFEESKPNATLIADAKTFTDLSGGDLGRTKVLAEVSQSSLYAGEELPSVSLSDSNRANLSYALRVAEALNISPSLVRDTVRTLQLPERRQQRTTMHGYDAIDDSYNISLSTAKAGLSAARALATEKGKKLLVVAAGITEAGPEEKEANKQLGVLLASEADHVAVLGSMYAREIIAGIADETKYHCYTDFDAFLLSAHADFPPTEWVVLFQPALPDLYY